MPALRKSRQSRTSTPFGTPADTPPNGSDSRKGKAQSSLDAWVEPAPQNPTPSFEEHGFARHGVLETMAPLGIPPSSKVRQKARGIGEQIKRPFFGKKSNAFLGEEEGTTPEMTPAPELMRDDSERQDDDDMQAAFPEQDEDEDDDYMPSKKKAKTSYGAKTPVRGKGSVHTKTSAHGKSPAKNGYSKASSSYSTPATQTAPAHDMDEATQQRIQIAVNDAIARSNKNNKRNVGAALKEMFETSRTDPQVAKALDGVIHQKETAEDWSFFRGFVKTVKKRFKKEQKIKEAKEAAEAQMKSALAQQSEAPSPEDSSEITPNDSASATIEAEPAIPASPTSSPENAFESLESPVEPEPASLAPHPLTTAPAFLVAEASSPPATKKTSKSPRKQQISNGKLAPETEMHAFIEASTAAPTPAAKSPESGGAASDSDLSDVNEDILRQAVTEPAPVQANGKSITAAQKKARSAAHARAGKKSRANSTKPWGKHKAPPLTPEQLAEQEELLQKRRAMGEGQSALMNRAAPMSDVRFDDEILETESLTESQIAVGPPVDSNRPRRAGRAPRGGMTVQTAGTKRQFDESRFSSPRLDSAATSRPTTPAVFSHVPNKRQKLSNGQAQAARTKKSPVKNRDGPIAGIPHTGGGGSRHSGPDDNDPGSPPSESDDLCSACKGAGEFVCCDNCPRVFHFLCCDPPRRDAPPGSFLCNECTAKVKPADESPVASSALLGPLFKSLESINPRSFALPQEIQEHFEDVAAKPDGSYGEDSKKIPLARSSGYGYQKPDYTKIFDSNHKPIQCASCSLTSGGNREMLKCDFCDAHWHLDCLDPPLANPPRINIESSQRDAWRCPRHVEHDLRSGCVLQNDLSAEKNDATMGETVLARLGRKIRKPRHPTIVEPTFSRGMRNNGLIEIMNDPDDDTDGEGNYVFPTDEGKDPNSTVYRVPEKGLVLDFITKVRSGRVMKKSKSAEAAAQRKASLENFAVRPIKQQQAALNLTKLANKEKDIGLNETSVEALILSLTAEAPNDVVVAMTDAPPPPVSDNERVQLLKLQELIKMRLGG